VPLRTLALPDGFAPARERSETHRRHGLDGPGIADWVAAELALA
jgi:hypothetical protein